MMRNWLTQTRYYQVMLTQDLLGDWVLVRGWGGRFNDHGRQKTLVVPDFETGVKAINAIAKIRAQRGYVEVSKIA